MQASTRFPIAVNTLLGIRLLSRNKKMTSELMAKSAGCNPVIIREITGKLKAAGFIEVAPGKGGATMKVAPEDITLWDIYAAVETMPASSMFKMHPNPYEGCPVGRNIEDVLSAPFERASSALRDELSSITLADLYADLKQKLMAERQGA